MVTPEDTSQKEEKEFGTCISMSKILTELIQSRAILLDIFQFTVEHNCKLDRRHVKRMLVIR